MSRPRLIACAYAVLLVGVTLLGWVPALADRSGRMFGVFRLTWYNDALHLSSASWAAIASLWSESASLLFLRVFGALYLLDGVMGLAIGSGYLDLGILIRGIQTLPVRFKIEANTPHIVLGSIALIASFARQNRAGSE